MRTIILLTLASALILVSCTPKLAPGSSGSAQGGLFDKKSRPKKDKGETPPLKFVKDPDSEKAPVQGDDELSRLAEIVTDRPQESIDTEGQTTAAKEEVSDSEPESIAAPPTHNFEAAETEHVKISRYDPFGGKSRFTVDLDRSGGVYPHHGKYLSGFGYRGRSMHTGVDIKGVRGDTIRTVFAGTVRMSKPYSGYGNAVVVRHDNGLETLYSHNLRNLVRVGDKVEAGDAVALIGRTGRATTEHCHFEVRVQGQAVNPASLLDYDNQRLRSGVMVISKKGGSISTSNRASSKGMAVSQTSDQLPTVAEQHAETQTAKPHAQATTIDHDKPSVHVVVKGDTLSAIARRYGISVSKLCALNGITPTGILSLKQKIKLR